MQPEFPQKALPLGAMATTAASGGNRESLLGPRPAGCKRQRSRRWEPQLGRWHCEAMTERARTLTKKSLIAARRLCRDGLALSGAHAPALPEGEPFALSPYTKRGPDKNVRPSLRSVLIPPWSRALPQSPALQPVRRALLLRGQQASPRASGDTDRPSAGRG